MHKREFLDEMELVVPWAGLVALIAPHTLADGVKGGRPPFAVQTMLRIRFLHNCFDNAVMESFSGKLKPAYLHLAAFDSVEARKTGLHEYIRYFNHERIGLGLQGLNPVEYRLRNTV